jgi:2-methylisocitrate lyase-like PEP mutase family enzyme
MDNAERARRGEHFRELHNSGEILVLPNPWDMGTARIFANLGFQGLATTSAGLAFSLGRRDGDAAVSRDETLEHARTIVDATPLPVTADLENGFGESPETVAETVRLAGEIGLAGASIEDATYRHDNPILACGLAIERVQAAVEAARALPYPFTLTARSENFIRGIPDLDDTLTRLQAFEAAGADVLYAPGLPDESAASPNPSTMSRASGRPVSASPSSRSSECAGSRSVPPSAAPASPPSFAQHGKCSATARSTTSTAFTPWPTSTNSSIRSRPRAPSGVCG